MSAIMAIGCWGGLVGALIVYGFSCDVRSWWHDRCERRSGIDWSARERELGVGR